jgi:dihydrofolate reductase
MNELPKFVFSKTLEKADWNNTQLISRDASEELTKLKQQPGKDLFVFGSADLSTTFIRHNLIDEYRIMVNPIILGKGVPLFKENGSP